MKDELVKNFYESTDRERWFLELYMSVMSFAMTELINEIHKENLNLILPSIVDSYYKKGVEYPMFP